MFFRPREKEKALSQRGEESFDKIRKCLDIPRAELVEWGYKKITACY